MARADFYASPFGVAYSAYMERPWLSRPLARAVWGGDTKPYYESMAAVAEVPDGGTIVDCPCGAGPALRTLRPDAKVRYVAADLSPSMLRRARKRARTRGLEDVELLEADATDLPLEEDSADLFLSYWGLHCFDDPPAALAEAARVLAPGGRLVGSTFVRGTDTLRQRLLVRPGAGDFGRIGTQAEVESWLATAGFGLLGVRRSGPMLYLDARASSVANASTASQSV
jgi:SAM-dependent methyltransferase